MRWNWQLISVGLFLVVIIETTIILGAIVLISGYMERESICQTDECFGYDFYIYDDTTGLCSCYEQDGTLDKRINLKYSIKSEEES